MFSRSYGNQGLTPAANYDPSQSYIPATSFFDDRSVYLTTQADLTIQKSARLSFDFGGIIFLTKYRSSARYDTTGVVADCPGAVTIGAKLRTLLAAPPLGHWTSGCNLTALLKSN
jgi:hypothetical protein